MEHQTKQRFFRAGMGAIASLLLCAVAFHLRGTPLPSALAGVAIAAIPIAIGFGIAFLIARANAKDQHQREHTEPLNR